MLYEYCINNDLSKEQILAVLKEYDSIKKFETNNVEDVIKECNEFGLKQVSEKYGVDEKYLKETLFTNHNTTTSTKKPRRAMKKYLKLNDKLEKEIKLLLDNGYNLTNICKIEYGKNTFINPDDVRRIKEEEPEEVISISGEPIADIFD